MSKVEEKKVEEPKLDAPAGPPNDIKVTVENWENISKFLRGLANNVAVVPNFSSEVVRSCLIVAVFLEDRATAVRQQAPEQFEEKEKKNESVRKAKKSV